MQTNDVRTRALLVQPFCSDTSLPPVFGLADSGKGAGSFGIIDLAVQGDSRRFIGHPAVDGRQDAEWQRPLLEMLAERPGNDPVGSGFLRVCWPRFTLLSKFRLHLLAYMATLALLSVVATAALQVHTLSGVEVALAATMLG